MKSGRGSVNKMEGYRVRNQNSFKLELTDIPFLVIGGFTLYEIIEIASVLILGKVIP